MSIFHIIHFPVSVYCAITGPETMTVKKVKKQLSERASNFLYRIYKALYYLALC